MRHAVVGSYYITAMHTADFHYELPVELIAQEPPLVRGSSRMMVLERGAGLVSHKVVSDLPQFLRSGDLLVVNDTRVFPARLLGQWQDSGGAVELLLLEQVGNDPSCWRVLVGTGRRLRSGLCAVFAEGAIEAAVIERGEGGEAVVSFNVGEQLLSLLEIYGTTPLPPYIRRVAGGDHVQQQRDRERYQTIYAAETGAVAAPTAGLHLTEELVEKLQNMGVDLARVTLHVGPGTFKPVKSELVEEHRMDPERYHVCEATAEAITRCRAQGGRVVAVGSTTVRTLETVAAENGGVVCATSGRSRLFIYPPYNFRVVDVMLTNFHLPCSTLIMMVAALAGRETVLAAYQEAVRQRYAFFSYGDCMLIV